VNSIVVSHEGIALARWLNSIGVAAFILKYRVMHTDDTDASHSAKMAERRKTVIPLAIADGQQAVRLVRLRAPEWGPPDRIGILGFSAGGYVAAAVALHHDADSRPNFAGPIYPGTPDDVTVPAHAPPLFLVDADDDKVVTPLDHSIRLYAAWKKLGSPPNYTSIPRAGTDLEHERSPCRQVLGPTGFVIGSTSKAFSSIPKVSPPWGVRARVDRPDASWHTKRPGSVAHSSAKSHYSTRVFLHPILGSTPDWQGNASMLTRS